MRSVVVRVAISTIAALSIALIVHISILGQCQGLFHYDVEGGARYSESCTVPGQPSYGWLNWYLVDWNPGAPEPTCYDYRPPYCNYADVDTTPAPDVCGDERDAIKQEYATEGVAFRPFCSSFIQSGGYGSFMFPTQLNHGHHAWGDHQRSPL